MFFGLGLREPPNRPPCFSVAHLFGLVDKLFRRFFGPMLTYLGSNRLKLLPVISRGSLSLSSLSKRSLNVNKSKSSDVATYLSLHSVCRLAILSRNRLTRAFYTACSAWRTCRCWDRPGERRDATAIVPKFDVPKA